MSTSSKITVEITDVTPELATHFLEKSTVNRPLEDTLAQTYAKLMKEEEWLLNGKTIVFDEDGFMRNGLHRCHACIAAGTPFPSVVISGPSRDAFSNLSSKN
ncbi:MAG: hypothetical protein COY40_04305 [Alphaproteobacteria bacterium CG_4_10_14_0_8_um_filter_53_9]|nr:MAG: hypothetical protein COY40_04305 [Alphaproteobacteria bacterium CG_4_10_14_0_8_um_filter_53_9]